MTIVELENALVTVLTKYGDIDVFIQDNTAEDIVINKKYSPAGLMYLGRKDTGEPAAEEEAIDSFIINILDIFGGTISVADVLANVRHHLKYNRFTNMPVYIIGTQHNKAIELKHLVVFEKARYDGKPYYELAMSNIIL